jgi:hypothetical protein
MFAAREISSAREEASAQYTKHTERSARGDQGNFMDVHLSVIETLNGMLSVIVSFLTADPTANDLVVLISLRFSRGVLLSVFHSS